MKFQDAAFKADVRERQARTGEHYTRARRELINQREAEHNLPWLRDALQPTTVTGVVSGGGLTNWAFALPGLQDLRDRGHLLFVADHDSGSRAMGPASMLDFIGAAGLGGAEKVGNLYADASKFGTLAQLVEDATGGVTFASGQAPFHWWREQLITAADSSGRPAVMYVQDIEVDGPFPEQPQLSRVPASVALPAQMRALAELAEQTQAIIVVCEPEPVEPGDGEWSIASVSHRAAVIGVDMFDGEDDSRPLRSVELHQFARGDLAQTVSGYVDYRPTMWRDVALALRR